MNSKKIVLAQTIKELKFLLSKLKKEKNLFCVPLDFQTQLYCMNNGINFLNPKNYIVNRFHQNALIESEKMLKQVNFNKNFNFSEIITIKAFLRFHFNSIVFLEELIDKISLKEKVSRIYVSGWNNYDDTYSEENYFITYILISLYKKKITVVSKNKKIIKKNNINEEYELNIKNLPSKKIIILTNLGYNFFRIIKSMKSFNKNLIFLSPKIKSLSLVKRLIFKILNVKFFYFKKRIPRNKLKIKLPKVKYKYKKKYDLSKILNKRIDQEKNNLFINKKKFFAIKEFFLKVKPFLVISNNSRNIDGQYLDCSRQMKIPSICIPHGTISEYFNKFDKVYKKTIAESVTYPKINFISQSKISSKYYTREKKNYKKLIECGNLIFEEKKIFSKKNKKRIFYGVTMKNFQSIQFLGVEMYYEYLDNLFFLNEIANTYKLEIVVKNHPLILKFTSHLQSKFKNLSFTNEKLDKILSKTDVTISFSSTIIEDSINSFVPVILLDRWQRYKHCKAEINPAKKNKPIYYITNEKNLIKCLNTIFTSNKIQFNKYIFEKKSDINIRGLLKH